MTDSESLHPIHDIPNELLAKVFVSIAQFSLREWYESTTSPGAPWSLPFPMVACAVCRHWREVALNTPELWATIYIPMFTPQQRPTRALTFDPSKFTTQWLARSKAASLDVFLAIPPHPLAFDLSAEILLPKVITQTHRLRRLVVSGNLDGLQFPNVRGMLTLIGTGLASPACVTETLSLRFLGGNTSSRLTDKTSLLDRHWDLQPDSNPTYPSIRSLHFEGIRINPALFPSLVNLTVAGLASTVEEFHQLFRVLPNLRRLTLQRLHVYVESGETPQPIEIPNLEFLSLGFTRRPLQSTQTYPAAWMRARNLRTLELCGQTNPPICSCLGTPFTTAIEGLQTLRLVEFVRFAHDATSETTVADIRLLRTFSSIRQLDLIQCPGIGALLNDDTPAVGTARRRTGSLSHRPAVSPSLAGLSRTLEGVMQQMRINSRPSVETTPIEAGTAVSIAEPVPESTMSTANPPPNKGSSWPELEVISINSFEAMDAVSLCEYVSRNGNIKSARLSGPARRHLSDSVKRRKADGSFFVVPSRFLSHRAMGRSEKADEATPDGEVESARAWLDKHIQILPFEDEF